MLQWIQTNYALIIRRSCSSRVLFTFLCKKLFPLSLSDVRITVNQITARKRWSCTLNSVDLTSFNLLFLLNATKATYTEMTKGKNSHFIVHCFSCFRFCSTHGQALTIITNNYRHFYNAVVAYLRVSKARCGFNYGYEEFCFRKSIYERWSFQLIICKYILPTVIGSKRINLVLFIDSRRSLTWSEMSL